MKAWLQDFPGQNAATATALVLIFLTGLAVVGKLIVGQVFPDGYDTWIWALIALAGVNVAGMVGKRFTDVEYKKAGTSPVTVGGPSDVTVNTVPDATQPPATPPATPKPTAARGQAPGQAVPPISIPTEATD